MTADSWQSLQLNLPVVPITDLMVRRDDLVLATQGRAFWIVRRPFPTAAVRRVAG